MLVVTTTGDGPKGKKVDEFLYKYDNSNHIFIMCFYHSVFLSPTDFVKYANHLVWFNPMKYINIDSPPPCKVLTLPNNHAIIHVLSRGYRMLAT